MGIKDLLGIAPDSIIAFDFDGTLVESIPLHARNCPDIVTSPIPSVIRLLQELHADPTIRIILFTCREGLSLEKAIEFCRDILGVEFDAINENVPELKNKNFAIRKPYFDMLIDDRVCTLERVAELYKRIEDGKTCNKTT